MKKLKLIALALMLATNTFGQEVNIDFSANLQERVEHFGRMRNIGIVSAVSGTAIAAVGISLGVHFHLENQRIPTFHVGTEATLEAHHRGLDYLRKANIWYSIGIVGGAIMTASIPTIVIGAREVNRLNNPYISHSELVLNRTRMRNTGIFMTLSGATLTTISSVFASRNFSLWNKYAEPHTLEQWPNGTWWGGAQNLLTGERLTRDEYLEFRRDALRARDRGRTWTVLGLVGGSVAATGIPLWVIGASETRRYNAIPQVHIATNGLSFLWNF